MSSLVDFLVSRLDEDEAVARAATDGGYGWRLTDSPGANEVWADRDASGRDAFMVATTCTTLNPNPAERGYRDAAHIARHDPARVLVEVQAKRAIVEVHFGSEGYDGRWWCNACADGAYGDKAEWPCPTLRLLASVFSDHPAYRQEWTP